MHRYLAAAVCAALLTTSVAAQSPPKVAARNLEADVAFLASDTLLGRATPSPGLEAAAEFIAAGFRRAGLEPIGDDGYFQTARFERATPTSDGLAIGVTAGGTTVKAGLATVTLQEPAAADLRDAAVVVVNLAESGALDALRPDQVRGKVLVIDAAEAGGAAAASTRRLPALTASLEPALVLVLRPTPAGGPAPGAAGVAGRASAPPPRPRLREAAAAGVRVPILVVADPAFRSALIGARDATISATVPAPTVEPVALRNVVGLLRGSDPSLRETYAVVSAHYDHVGVRATGEGDSIYNGANDNASGVAMVMEAARVLGEAGRRPKRSLVFLAVFGEESGMLGSTYYCQHPVVPLDRTVVNVNFEQLGRTDDNEGPRLRQFNLTGFDFTDLGATFSRAARKVGIQAVKHAKNSDAYFGGSDNIAFASRGVPSTTISVTYAFPDYHRAEDEWEKIDFANMAVVGDAIVRGLVEIANAKQAPAWNRDNPGAARFATAGRK